MYVHMYIFKVHIPLDEEAYLALIFKHSNQSEHLVVVEWVLETRNCTLDLHELSFVYIKSTSCNSTYIFYVVRPFTNRCSVCLNHLSSSDIWIKPKAFLRWFFSADELNQNKSFEKKDTYSIVNYGISYHLEIVVDSRELLKVHSTLPQFYTT